MPTFNRDTRTEYHLITCDHPLMMDMGMGSFTLPEFVQWWNFRDGSGKYVNRIQFTDEKIYGLSTIIGFSRDYGDNFIIKPWRFEDYNIGIYQRYRINPELESFDTPVWNYYNNNPDCPPEDLDNFDFSALQMSDVKAKTFNRITRLFDDYITEDIYAADLIALNDYYNIVGYDLEKDIDRATRQFFRDIKRSKNSGCVTWRNKVSLNLRLTQDSEPCVRVEEFNFKLFLYDKKRPVNRTKSTAVESVKIAAPAIGPDGINSKGKEDGESTAVVDDSPNNKVGGTLKTSYRSYDGKFSAGSEEIFGIVSSETIPAAKWMANPEDWAKNLDIEENFRNVDGEYLIPGTGEIFPLDLQNGNPFQWAPNYANPSGCRGENKDKVKLKVFNMSPRSYNKSDAVTATDRYSLWFIDPVASSDITFNFKPKGVRNWQFSYFLTNEPHYLRFADGFQESNGGGRTDRFTHENTNVRHRDAENSLSRKHFKTALGQAGYAAYFNSLSFEEKDAGTSWEGYAQLTSWDFMAPPFGGLREKKGNIPLGNALVLTASRVGHDGNVSDFNEIYNSYGTPGRGRITAPFFGCAFPDGYLAEEKYSLYNGVPKHPDETLSGSGWRPASYNKGLGYTDLTQNESFFNQSYMSYISENPMSGIFDPHSRHNNVSSNISPFYFLTKDQKDPDDDNYVEHVNLFSTGPAMNHLPADIALNASWKGEYGGPIPNLNNIQKYITNPASPDASDGTDGIQWNNAADVQANFHDFFLDSGSFQWLYNTIDFNKKEFVDDPDNSLLDLRPQDPTKVDFRPARDGLFAQFDPPQPFINPSIYVVGDRCMSYPNAFLIEQGFTNFPDFGGSITSEGGGNSRYGLSQWGGNEPLWGYKTKNRLIFNDAGGFTAENNQKGLFIYRDSPDGYPDPELDGKIMPFNYSAYRNNNAPEWVKGLKTNYQCPLDQYCNNPTVGHTLLASSPGGQSRGMFGVIGAIMTTSAPDEGIEFVTESYIGQPMYGTVPFFASAGGRSTNYYDANSTALYVKVYESWPREQLIYDPRFYAVHHFNAGNKLQVSNNLRPWEDGYTFGENITYDVENQPNRVFSSGTQEISTLNFIFDVDNELVTSGVPIVIDKSITNVDMRQPSFYDNVSFPSTLGGGEPNVRSIKPFEDPHYIFKEGARHSLSQRVSFWMPNNETVQSLDNPYDMSSEQDKFNEWETFRLAREKYTPIAKPEHWAIDNDRRARMLPWPYYKTVIAPQTPYPIDLSAVRPEQTLYDIVQAQGGASMIIKASGQDYVVGERFELQGGNGTGGLVEIKQVDENGSPIAFDWASDSFTFYDEGFSNRLHGEGYLPEDFVAGETSGINVNTSASIKLIPESGTNRSFAGYLLVGATYTDRVIDYKPRIATTIKGPYKLSAPDNSLLEAGAVTWRDTLDIEIIPMGQGVILGDGTSTIGFPALENTDAVRATTTAQVVISMEGSGNPNVVDGDFDCFFYAVNDASHTWIESDGQPVTVENYMTMKVNAY